MKTTKELREILRSHKAASTEVEAWYAHAKEVRGPFGRWFTCSHVPPEYSDKVADTDEDCMYAAAAMNLVPNLLDDLDTQARMIEVMRKALEQIRIYADNEEVEMVMKECLADVVKIKEGKE